MYDRSVICKFKGSDFFSSLLSTEAFPEMLYPVLGPTLEEGCEQTGRSPVESNKNDWSPGKQDLRRKPERTKMFSQEKTEAVYGRLGFGRI